MRYLPLFAAIFAITPLAIDLYLPAMPEIALSLGTNIQSVQNSLSLYLAGYALGMFIFGPLADRIGRRPLLLLGLFGFTLLSFALSLASSIESFLALRFFQAMLGGAATVVIPGAIRHLFGKQTAKGFSYVAMIMMIAPMVAPAIGSQLMLLGNWRWIFVALSIYSGVMLVIAYFKFPLLETKQESTDRTNWLYDFVGAYRTVLAEKSTRFWILASMLTSFGFFAYITNVSFIYMNRFGLSEIAFGYIFGLNVVGLIGGSLLNTRLVPRFGSKKVLSVAALLFMIWGILLTLTTAWVTSQIVFITLVMLFTATSMIITANSDALILQHFYKNSGTATAVIGTLRFGCGASAGPILAIFHDGTELPFAMMLSLVGAMVWLVLQIDKIDLRWFTRRLYQS